jgi:hypothetical protein
LIAEEQRDAELTVGALHAVDEAIDQCGIDARRCSSSSNTLGSFINASSSSRSFCCPNDRLPAQKGVA